MTREETIVNFLRENKAILNISAFAEIIGIDKATLHKIVKGDPYTALGKTMPMPEKYFDAALAEIERLKQTLIVTN